MLQVQKSIFWTIQWSIKEQLILYYIILLHASLRNKSVKRFKKRKKKRKKRDWKKMNSPTIKIPSTAAWNEIKENLYIDNYNEQFVFFSPYFADFALRWWCSFHNQITFFVMPTTKAFHIESWNAKFWIIAFHILHFFSFFFLFFSFFFYSRSPFVSGSLQFYRLTWDFLGVIFYAESIKVIYKTSSDIFNSFSGAPSVTPFWIYSHPEKKIKRSTISGWDLQ